jgi:hypothetical protein
VGRAHDEIAAQTRSSRTGVFDIWMCREAAGPKAFARRNPWEPQRRHTRNFISEKTLDQLNMPCALWTRAGVSHLIEHRFGPGLPAITMGPYLARWGFTPQEPINKACEHQGYSQERFLMLENPRVDHATPVGIRRGRDVE